MANKFVVSVADAYLYDKCKVGYWAPFVDSGDGTALLATRTAIFSAKTLTDSSFETTVSSQDTRGGFGNALLNVFYHSAEMTVNFTDAKMNLMALKALVGDSAFAESGASNNVITIAADFVPENLEVVFFAKLAGETAGGCTGVIGNLLIHIPIASLDGASSIAMTADGVANTPFKARALADDGFYAKIYELGLATVGDVYLLTVLTSGTYIASVYYTRTGAGTELEPYIYTLSEGAFSGGAIYYAKYEISFAARE